jgi:peptidoglycan/xylan/chitin deacetylase (PgdA/CDA1 family)
VRLPGNIRVTQTLRRLLSFVRGGVAILGYHRLHRGADPLYLSVAPERFEEHLQAIARVGYPLSLSEAASALARGRVPRRAVVLTFDDGYSDNLHVALPLLERYGVPATMFITSSNRGQEFWWDRLERLGAGASGDVEAIAHRLEGLDEAAREAALRELEQQSGRTAPEAVHRALTAEELKLLAASPLVEIGAHTVTHRALPSLPPGSQREEIERCRTDLELQLGRPVTSFAYPHGAVTPAIADLVAAAGYTAACCSRVDVATARSSPFLLPRLWTADWGGTAFERWLRGWVHG